jgi:hypothetical protein
LKTLSAQAKQNSEEGITAMQTIRKIAALLAALAAFILPLLAWA